METLLFLVSIIGCLVIALGRVTAIRPVAVSGKPIGEVSLPLVQRVRYHRGTIYSVGGLLLLGSLTGMVAWPLEVAVIAATIAVVRTPVRYRFTTEGVALGRILFRPWNEFSGYRASERGVLLAGKTGNGGFRFRTGGALNEQVRKIVAGRLTAIPATRATFAPSGFRRLKYAIVLAPAAALLLALGGTALADGPEVDPSGTKVGTAEDLGGIGIGGGQGFAVTAPDGSFDADATAKAFADAKEKEPFAYNLAGYVNQNRLAINFVWVLVAGYLVMFMQAGFAMVETGFCRAKSAMHVMMTNFMIYGVGMLAYWAVGFAIAFGGVGLTGPTNLGAGLLTLDKEWMIGDYGIVGYKGFFLSPGSLDVGIAVLFLFQMVFMDTAATILTGAVAERWRFLSLLIWGVFIGALIQPVIANWAWGGGWLFGLVHSGLERPYVDFAGSGVVHMVGGFAALGGAWILGPRLGKYNNDGSANAIPGHNLNMAAIGTFILAFGWFGFNPGSTLGAAGSGNLRIGEIAVVTMLAGAAGSMAAMAYAKATLGKYDPGYMINGLLAGLVAITAPSGYVSPILAVLIGSIGGVLVCVSMVFVERTMKIDDPVGAISVHGVCGAFGVLAVGLFADGTAPDYLVVGHPIKGLFFGDGRQLLVQVIGIGVIAAWSFATTAVLFKVLQVFGVLRSSPEEELKGLDLPEMGTHAYPVEDVPSERGIEPGAFIPGVTPPLGSSAGGGI
jgi:Amt family ammonium transporter